MAHPIGNQHRADKVQKSRVGKIAHGYASGGGIRDDGMPMPRAKGGVVKAPARMAGGPVKARADKVSRAKGGRVKHKGTNVNVIIAPSGQKPSMMPPAPPMAAAPPPMPPKPPMTPPPPGAVGPVAGVGGMPPVPPRADGGRAYKKGGAVKAKMSGEKKHGKHEKPFKMRAMGGKVDASVGGTKVQHSGNKSDTQNIGRGPVITRATGGPIYSDGKQGKQMAWLKGEGAGGGKARLAKAARNGGHEPWAKDAAS